MTIDSNCERRDYRVFWRSLFSPYSKATRPAVEPFMTLEEALEEARTEAVKGYTEVWVIDRKGHGV